jgi:hypothetical protein
VWLRLAGVGRSYGWVVTGGTLEPSATPAASIGIGSGTGW